ncbi:MAG: tyrosinase family protein [Pseudomonadota bacterium]
MSQRINQDFIDQFNQKFTETIALKYRRIHADNCHHWDYTFLPWHRKFVTQFWTELDLPRTYAVLTEDADRQLYASLVKSVLPAGNGFQFVDDRNKLNSFTTDDLAQMKVNIAEGMACKSFALDLDLEGSNRFGGLYNLSFSSQIQEFHDIIHGETGASMRSLQTAGGDQCFFMHHTFVDLIFETWLNDNPELGMPVPRENFEASPDLQQDYDSYEELESLFSARYFAEEDYKIIRRIIAPLTRFAVFFDRIEHSEGYRRVIMYYNSREIGRFAILTGQEETCVGCARRQAHTGQFLIQELVPVTEISWNIDNQWFTDFQSAVQKFSEIGMSAPRVVSF